MGGRDLGLKGSRASPEDHRSSFPDHRGAKVQGRRLVRQRRIAARSAVTGSADYAFIPSGTVNQNVLPRPASLSTPIVPPWAATISRAIDRPRPAPPGASAPWENLSKITSRRSGAMPGPSSLDLEAHRRRWPRHANRDRGAGGRVADGVGEQVGEDELQAVRVDRHLGEARRDLGGERPPAVRRRWCAAHRARCRRASRTATGRRCSWHASALQLGQIEQLVDDALQALAVLARGVAAGRPGGR